MSLRKKTILFVSILFIVIIVFFLSEVSKKSIMGQDTRVSDVAGKMTLVENVSGNATKESYTFPKSAVGKIPGNGNPLVSHKFGADPYALVYEGRVYLYMTNDVLVYDSDENVLDNNYGNINEISVISSDDLVNWTDHGVIRAAGSEGAAKWATQSWAPAAAHKVIKGKDRFFLYFANNASGVGVLTSDSPIGPWIDPIGQPLIERKTPGVENVTWIFDPAVFQDDDGKAYIYFGGGVPEGKSEMPNTARVMHLGDDMVSVESEALTIPAPYMFEDSGINKHQGKYYYTYCSNFYDGVRQAGSPPAGQIAYMVSDNPMGPWKYGGSILRNPGEFFDVGGNNHHSIFEFNSTWYIAYHAQTLSKAMGIPKGYRSTHLNLIGFNEDGTMQEVNADYEGVGQVKPLDPYVRVQAETMGWNTGVEVEQAAGDDGELINPRMVLTDIDNGEWIALSNVDFGRGGASSFKVSVASSSSGGFIELRLDSLEGQLIGTLAIPGTDDWNLWTDVETKISDAVGEHDLYLLFKGGSGEKMFKLDSWQFGI